jgi:hypothetical protein
MSEERIGLLIQELRSLQLRETEIIEEIELENRLRTRENPTTETINPTAETIIRTGDRVYITNRVAKPANWSEQRSWSATRERRATVTRVVPPNRYLRSDGKIYISTDNGVKTWRAAKNLRLLDRE